LGWVIVMMETTKRVAVLIDGALKPLFYCVCGVVFRALQEQVFQSLRQNFRYVAGAAAEACGWSGELIGKGQEQVGKWNVIAVMEV